MSAAGCQPRSTKLGHLIQRVHKLIAANGKRIGVSGRSQLSLFCAGACAPAISGSRRQITLARRFHIRPETLPKAAAIINAHLAPSLCQVRSMPGPPRYWKPSVRGFGEADLDNGIVSNVGGAGWRECRKLLELFRRKGDDLHVLANQHHAIHGNGNRPASEA